MNKCGVSCSDQKWSILGEHGMRDKCSTSLQPLKFNGTQIKLNSEEIVLTKESHIGGILLVKNYDVDSTSSRGITRIKLLPQEQYLAQRARDAYIAFICQPEASFNLFRAAQIVKFLSDDIAMLNKRL